MEEEKKDVNRGTFSVKSLESIFILQSLFLSFPLFVLLIIIERSTEID